MMIQSNWVCNICGWVGNDDKLNHIEETDEDQEDWRCPNCGSDDIEDSSIDPYNDPEDDLDEGLDGSIRI